MNDIVETIKLKLTPALFGFREPLEFVAYCVQTGRDTASSFDRPTLMQVPHSLLDPYMD